jgi:hypothetical protein
MRGPAIKTEAEGSKKNDVYSKPDNGQVGYSIAGGKETPNREPLLDMQARSTERERIVDAPTEKTIYRTVTVNKDQHTPSSLSIVTAKILKKIDGLRNVQTIADSLGLPYLYTAKALAGLSKSGLIERVSSSETSEIVPTQFVDLLNSALIDAMGPMAPLVIRDGLATLGHSSATLPKENLEKLVELVSSEILDDLLMSGFKERMSRVIGALSTTATASRSENE